MNIVRAWSAVLMLIAGVAFAANTPKTQLSADDVGKIWFASVGSIVKAGDRKPYALNDVSVTLSGELKFPDGAGPFPAVVLAHGCGGNGYAEVTWAPLLRQWGYATFIIDSFGGRGITSICDNIWRLVAVQRVPDAYGALRLLVTHPKIAPERVALMGFSHGGILTVNAATSWARETFAPEGKPHFRAFFPFYPYCNSSYPERESVSAPVRVHAGALDDWTPAKPCEEWADRLRAKGYDVTANSYAGAHHSFDAPFGAPVTLSSVFNAAACFPRYDSIFGPYEVGTNFSGCLKRGATAGRNSNAIQAAQEVLRGQLDGLLAAK